MSFEFKVTQIEKMPSAKIGVLNGQLISGKFKTGSIVNLIHGRESIPMKIKGVVLDYADLGDGRRRDPKQISLSVDLREHAMTLVQEGDRLVMP